MYNVWTQSNLKSLITTLIYSLSRRGKIDTLRKCVPSALKWLLLGYPRDSRRRHSTDSIAIAADFNWMVDLVFVAPAGNLLLANVDTRITQRNEESNQTYRRQSRQEEFSAPRSPLVLSNYFTKLLF